MKLLSILMLVTALALTVFALLWHWRRSSHSSPKNRAQFVAKESAQAAFLAGLPSQAGAIGMESALPFLDKLAKDTEAA